MSFAEMGKKRTIRFLIPLQIIDVEVEVAKNTDLHLEANNAFTKMLTKLQYDVDVPKTHNGGSE